MNGASPILAPSSDPLGEVLHMLRLDGTLYCRSELSAPWGIELPPMPGCMMFHIITAGDCLLEMPGAEPRRLGRGALVLIPHGGGHVLRNDSTAPVKALFDLPVSKVSERYEVLSHGGGGEGTQLTCGVLQFDQLAAERLIKLLPTVMQIDAWGATEDRWLQHTIQFISSEASNLRPGGETVITHLADILVIQAIRHWLDSAPAAQRGWLAALRDAQVGRALQAIHRTPRKGWSLSSLAKVACMSRSAFSARFSELVGEPAMQYLTHWRLQLARKLLMDTSDPLSVLAERVGYQSEAAFCRAFKRVFGASPGSLRRTKASAQKT